MVENVHKESDVKTVTQEKPKSKIIKISVGTETANFETAITATGFGKFNILLILVILPTAFSHVFETASMSYVLPVAQCDLSLSLQDKGLLNAITFAGMISSGFIWGYICDTLGRKKVMIIGYFLDGLFTLMGSFSQNFAMLLTAKFFGGVIINGPYSAATSYLSEFHSSKHRARVQLARGFIVSLGNITLPLLAWAVLPQDLRFRLFDYINFHSWNMFLLICSFFPFLSGVLILFMPESPTFLMSAGKNEEALRVFRKIYKINTGKPADTYPISDLIDETVSRVVNEKVTFSAKQKAKKAVMEGLYTVKPLFCRPHILRLVIACLNTFLMLMSTNTLKLWLPQLFQAINDYESRHNGSSSSMCDMLSNTLSSKNSTATACVVNLDNSQVYINSIIVGFTSILSFSFAGTIVNLLGKKKMTVTMAVIAGACVSCIYFAQNSDTVLALSAIFLAFAQVCGNVLITITLELFPTSLRAMALSVHLMCSRIGTVVGNMVFPHLLRTGCAPPFFYIGLLSFGCASLTLLYPDTENKALA